ncbi:SDR family oxidoreductase [Mycolicibacterium sp. S2-37]|uniref:SDR family NAD(P)-dependent oxidoreductase n=1 Tax=Mycolicibacterium sp. S2-37 TaxID=2810297 RepID=UPI001A93ACE3|nr:SDR family oxidoreductase [Mycolicibacterium sp. S2-37]MBO0680615.1 SDR family oxidoreductase [Mycolicibacterium sp. S2-37]
MTAGAVDALVGGAALAGRHAWVTGAGSGIGRACAIALTRLGATAHLVGRTAESLQETARLIGEYGGTAVLHVGDVTDTAFVSSLMAGQRVDVLVNSAGRNIAELLDDITPRTYAAVMRVNVEAVLFMTQQAVARMRDHGGGGSIVSIGSQMGHVGGPQRTLYCTSKWALEGMTKALALELAAERIRVNTVAPTFIETELTAQSLAKPEFRNWVLGEIPLGRLGTADEVAAAVAYLAGPASSLTTGTSLLVDGGWTAH